jgi:hypothetical protein
VVSEGPAGGEAHQVRQWHPAGRQSGGQEELRVRAVQPDGMRMRTWRVGDRCGVCGTSSSPADRAEEEEECAGCETPPSESGGRSWLPPPPAAGKGGVGSMLSPMPSSSIVSRGMAPAGSMAGVEA